MKRLVFAVLGVLAIAASPARADARHYVFDLIHRPASMTQSQLDAGVQAATATCDPQHRQDYETRRFAVCMRARGYKFLRLEREKEPPAPASPKLAKGHFIDPDNGMDCQNSGGAEICESPNGTTHYFDPDQGLPCTRTGILSVCSNM